MKVGSVVVCLHALTCQGRSSSVEVAHAKEHYFFKNPCCAAQGHALAVFNLLALTSSLHSDPLVGKTRSAPRNTIIYPFNPPHIFTHLPFLSTFWHYLPPHLLSHHWKSFQQSHAHAHLGIRS